MRLGKLALAAGLALLLGASMFGPRFSEPRYVRTDISSGIVFRAMGDIWLEAELIDDEGWFTLYVLDYENTNRTLMEGSLDNVSPMLEVRNIESFKGLVPIPTLGYYSILITSESNETLSVRVTMSTMLPAGRLLLVGMALIVVGASLSLSLPIMRRAKKLLADAELRSE